MSKTDYLFLLGVTTALACAGDMYANGKESIAGYVWRLFRDLLWLLFG